jgi:hypothetical protein
MDARHGRRDRNRSYLELSFLQAGSVFVTSDTQFNQKKNQGSLGISFNS